MARPALKQAGWERWGAWRAGSRGGGGWMVRAGAARGEPELGQFCSAEIRPGGGERAASALPQASAPGHHPQAGEGTAAARSRPLHRPRPVPALQVIRAFRAGSVSMVDHLQLWRERKGGKAIERSLRTGKHPSRLNQGERGERAANGARRDGC